VDALAAESFSPVAGGPLYRAAVRLGLERPPVEGLGRLALAFMTVSWLPTLLLAAASGQTRAFLAEFPVHVRLLFCLPLMIVADRLAHQRLERVPAQFLARELVPPEASERFERVVAAARRLRDGPAEVLVFAVIFAARAFTWRRLLPMEDVAWAGGRSLNAAGWWFVAVAVPLYQLVLARWLVRLAVWAGFLWSVRRLPLRLLPAHADRAGGLGFLAIAAYGFEPLLFTQSALLAAIVARASAPSVHFTPHAQVMAVVFCFGVLVILGPLAVFAFDLAAARRRDLRAYGELLHRTTRSYETRFLRRDGSIGPVPDDEALQAMGSLEQIYAPVSGMLPLPFGSESLKRLAFWTALPWVPSALVAGHAQVWLKFVLKALA
jgi:hypothetical protein